MQLPEAYRLLLFSPKLTNFTLEQEDFDLQLYRIYI